MPPRGSRMSPRLSDPTRGGGFFGVRIAVSGKCEPGRPGVTSDNGYYVNFRFPPKKSGPAPTLNLGTGPIGKKIDQTKSA